jgi:hypothetical protein
MTSTFLADWRVIPASVAGPNHNRMAVTCQDAFATAALPGNGYVLAVADGAGSASHSAHGARLAVEAAVRAAEVVFGAGAVDRPQWWVDRAAIEYATACVDEFEGRLAGATEVRYRRDQRNRNELRGQYATTLLAAVVYPPYLCYVSVGDGFLVVDREPGGPQLVVWQADTGANANETTFLTSAGRDGDLRAKVLVDPALAGIALCTDGLYEGMLTVGRDAAGRLVPVAPPEFRSYFRFFADDATDPAELTRKLGSREFAATSGDDKTIVLAVRQ